ncbi:hypothetical protein PR003_g10472 [Phytophthora rubi]|uniref:Ubiquitinyl hydrolase 1 n=2 Tax=Phytophthora rubi TaxID=129364 RepID=A0A6A4FAZ4_9STRA|nr:hypothetical protein PR003_g10472 [Phytophthora rubi]
MEAASQQLRALLGACAAASSQDADEVQVLTPEQLQFWDALCGPAASSESLALAADLALLLASTNVAVHKLLALLLHPSLHCAGLVRLAHLTFKGLKRAKRWDALSAASTQLLDAIYAKVLLPDTRERALRFYVEVLVGFQHSAELYARSVPQLVELAEIFSGEDENRQLMHPLLVACAALGHCHRGYEAEAMTLRRALRASFGARVDRPTAAEAERLLRSSAWVLPAETLDDMLPSVEGKWVVDEFVSDQLGSGAPQNAGSVLLKKTTNCFAHEVKATMVDSKAKQTLELTGYLFQQMPEMQVLLAHPERMEASPWELEGHWRQLHDETGPATTTVPMAPIAAPTWDCRACTMNNEGSATKCTTCGTERPADVNVPAIASTSKGSNPAPFTAVFSSDLSFMRMKWSRGEQQGVWLARKQIVEREFDLAVSLAAANDVMMDSTDLPAFVFSPEGNPASILVLERPVLSTSDRTEFTVQVWICPERSPSGNDAQVVLANEAAKISNVACDDEVDSSLRYFDGPAMLIKVSSEVVSPGIQMYELGLYIWSKKQGNPLSRVFRIAGGPSTAPSDVQIKYELPGRLLSVAIGGVGVVFEVAVDLELALQMNSNSPMRTGLIFPAANTSSPQTPTWLMKWKFASLTANSTEEAAGSVLGNVYSPLQSERSGSGDGENSSDNDTIMCTRVSTDGSAISQEAYGCQTCSLVHGSSVCRVCAVICHEGHELVALGVVTTACACHIRGNGLCRCNSAVRVSDFPLLNRPVNAPLWGCYKCTVLNSVDLKQCSVCGNNAPEINAAGTTSATPESTCTALALVEQPNPAVDWSCEACTMLNSAAATKCSMCDTLRAAQAEPEVVGSNQESKTDNGLTTLYYAAEDAAKQDHPVATRPTGPWICSACTMENQATDTSCHMCSTVREIPIAAAVDPSEVVMALPAPKVEMTPASSPMSMDMDGGAGGVVTPEPAVDSHTSKLENVKYLDEYKRTAALAFSHLLEIGSMNDSVWETTGGKMHVALDKSFVGEYIRGTYVEKDGKLSGLARLTEDGAWKLDGRFKKTTQSQSNACTLYWDKAASRFDGKWYRGDGSGDWKCLASPYASDFCGLAPTDPDKKQSELQPFYAGMVNMKQNLTNVCYQNSFLQTLYMTQDFRRLILSCDAQNYFAPYANSGAVSSGNVVGTIQDLFAQMTASQRPYLATHALQRCLPAEFKNGRQQDTSDFAHFLIDSLSQQLSQHENTTDDIASIFGGHQATILACKTCGKKSVNREYFWELLLNMIDLRYTPITSISAVSGSSMDIHTPEGYERLNSDLNKDRTGAPYVYLCVKRCPERATSDTSMEDDSERIMPITELVVKVALSTDPKPSLPGFERVDLDLNVGGGATASGKKQVYLFFRREPNGSPITDLQVIFGNESIPDGFKQIQVDLNQGDGSKVYLCYRCDMPITDLKIVNSGIPGYRMVEHLLNVSHEDAVKQYLALKVGGNEPCLTDLKLVEGSSVPTYEEQGWQSIGSPFSSAPLAEPSLSDEPFVPAQLMVRRGHGNPIFAIDVFRAPRQVPKYNDYEVIELVPAEASSDDVVAQIEGDWMGSEETDRGRKAVRLRSVSEPISDALLVKGALDDKGELSCVATRVSTWSDSITAASAPAADSVVSADPSSSVSASANTSSKVYRVSGYWKNAKVPSAQLFDVELRPAPVGVGDAPDTSALTSSQGAPARSYTISGTIGDGRGRPIAIQGVQTSRKVKIKWPISGIVVLRGDERVPEGVQVVRETCSGRSGNLLAQTASPHTLYLAVKREETPTEGYITDVCVIYGEIDAVPDHYTCIQTTPAGHSANLNDGTTGVPVFICFRRSGSDAAVDSESTPSAGSKSLMDLALMWTSGAQPDTLPTGYTKIQHTPLGMEANLNQGTSGVAIHICYSKCDVKDIVKPLENALNGEYEITSSPLPAFGRFLSLSVVEELEEVRTMEGNFGIVLHSQLIGSMSGLLVTSKHQQSGDKKNRTIAGVWRIESPMAGGVGASMSDFLPSSYPFELTLNESGTEMDGWWSGAEGAPGSVTKPAVSVVTPSSGSTATNAASASTPVVIGGKWKIIKDSYVHVAFKKDYSTEWQDGQLVFSERVWRHDIESMLSRFVATRTLGGDNALSCSVCERKTESRTHTVIFEPPEHLIITLKRMSYDWNQQKACKCLHDVSFPAFLTLPSLTAEEELAVYDSANGDSTRAKQQNQSRHYGLYGVLVHSGLTANSGHYYSFCRESDESTRQLHLEDSTLSPWIKFNDTKVERSNWKEINRLVASTVSDTVYLLLYKKLSYELTPSHGDGDQSAEAVSSDDEEAMLLAKAMALSMSAAKQNQSRQIEEETKDDADVPNNVESEDSTVLSTSGVTKALLKKVEEENTAYLQDSLAATSSALHADDLHTLLVLRHSLPLHVRSLLDEIC